MNRHHISLIVTSIFPPNDVMHALAQEAARNDALFIVVGDTKSPSDYQLEGAEFYSINRQHDEFGPFSRALPTGHYARKNIGYLAALRNNSDWLLETDDDNFPLATFFDPPADELHARQTKDQPGWINAYAYFEPEAPIWPRGLPLQALTNCEPALLDSEDWETVQTSIVQGLANDNPDVDAVFRLTRSLPVSFNTKAQALRLQPQHWCPFNSQNTWTRRKFSALSYLPSYCSFRMTDIWRSFVAQRCLWAQGHSVIFTAPTVRQYRNQHDLLRDFADEVPGYLNNQAIADCLSQCKLVGDSAQDLLSCYQSLVSGGYIPAEELPLIRLWLDQIESALGID